MMIRVRILRAAAVLAIAVIAATIAIVTVARHVADTAAAGQPAAPRVQTAPMATPVTSCTGGLDRAAALATAQRAMTPRPGEHVDRIAIRLTTFGEYLSIMSPGTRTTGVDLSTPTWVVAMQGLWHPFGDRGGQGAYRSGIFLIGASSGHFMGVRVAENGETWPAGFDALPDHATLACVPN